MSLTDRQARAVRAPGSVAVVAGAGSGKTHLLVERFAHHVLVDGLSPLSIVAVTFTDAAAAELRARVRAALARARPLDLDVLAEVEAAPVSTLHALCARIVRDFPREAGVPPGAALQDEGRGAAWFATAFEDACAALPAALAATLGFDRVVELLAELLRDPLLAEAALAVGDGGWADLVARAREEARETLAREPAWRAALATLAAVGGADDDRIEETRRAALEAARRLERGEDALADLLDLKLVGGSARNWPGGGFAEAKSAITALRDLARDRAPLLGLTLGEADEALRTARPDLREAFAFVRARLDEAARRDAILTFDRLEEGALRALARPEVRTHYARRWRAFLLDEAQDTNPVQAELLARLAGTARLTVVGDEKQGIYAFRRADVETFRALRARVVAEGGEEVTLDRSFRTHDALVERGNAVFAPLLGELHAPLVAVAPSPFSRAAVEAHLVAAGESGLSAAARGRAEAALVARRVRALLDAGFPVRDGDGGVRPLRPADVAVLTRSWAGARRFVAALGAAGVPAREAGGGSLLGTREAQDGAALLAALALRDETALLAVLRSPLGGASDAAIAALHARREGRDLFAAFEGDDDPRLAPARGLLAALSERRRELSPSRLLQLADRLTGYTAVLANLWGPERRLEDWRAFLGLVRALERGHEDPFVVARALRDLAESGAEVPRPKLEAGDAVTVTTMHGAKGLEWPLVVVGDLAWTPPPATAAVRADERLGLAFRLPGLPDPALLTILAERAARREAAEARRLLYVALTRARDHLVLASADGPNERNLLGLLWPGLVAAGVEVAAHVPDPADTRLPDLPDPPLAPDAG